MHIYSKKRKIFFMKSNKGFAVLFSVLLASFLITLGISIFSISLKEIQITTSVRDSQIAYYIADSARECALYWDVKQGAFPACLDSSCSTVSASTTPTITCNGNPITLTFVKNGLAYSTYNASNMSNIVTNFFIASSTSSSTPVADIMIKKEFISPNVVTTIEARGHNTSILGRRVERGIRQTHN
jgi:Tfp pilus assembly protein PilX